MEIIMAYLQMGAAEARFADLVWENEPVASGELSRIAEEKLGWKKTTSFTVLKRLCDKGFFRNEKGTVTSQISREQFYSRQSETFVETAYKGSLPAFIAAFTDRKGLKQKDLDEIRRMLDEYEESKK